MYYFVHNGVVHPCNTKQLFVNTLCVYLDGETSYNGELRAFVSNEEVTVKKVKGEWVFSTAHLGEVWRGRYAYYENEFVEVEQREVM